MKRVFAMVVFAQVFALGAAHALADDHESSPQSAAEQLAGGLCAACHGANGMSMVPSQPHLAGQHAAYIAKQLANFKSGARQNAIMAGMAAALSEEDMAALGRHYAALPPPPPAGTNAELAKTGESIYRYGIASKGLPACSGCHAPNGAGIPDQYPRLAGQFADYLYGQLRAFAAHERANDSNAMMRGISSRLSDTEMRAVAEYLAGLK